MHYSTPSFSLLLLLYVNVLVGLAATLSPDLLERNISVQALVSPQHLKPFTDISIQTTHNGTSNPLSDLSGCYIPAPGMRPVSPQDALIALGNLASTINFFGIRRYRDFAVLADWRSAAIVLVKIATGPDDFSIFDVASQALQIIHYCIIQQPAAQRFGGVIEIGSRNKFRLIVQARAPFEDGTS